MVEEKENGRVVLCKKTKKTVCARQEAPAVYDMNASIYFYTRDYFRDKKNLTVVLDNSLAYVMDEISYIDIDNEIDFKFVEFLIKEGLWKDEV